MLLVIEELNYLLTNADEVEETGVNEELAVECETGGGAVEGGRCWAAAKSAAAFRPEASDRI